jgi:cobalt-zinc-cadmium resistance protein CzcA
MQDWILQRRFRAVPGVIDVTGWGGKTRQYEVEIDLNKLIASKLTLPQVIQTLSSSNINVGGNTIDIGSQSAVVRGVGLIRSEDDLKNTMLAQNGGFPILVSDIAIVKVGAKPRLGIAGMNGDDDIVQGVVLMRRGEQSTPTIERVEREVESINNSSVLPPGVRIKRIYDRKDLIDTTTRTVLHNMLLGIALIFAVQWLFLGDFRSALIVGATVPFALSFAIGIMVLRGESANLLSVGAIDFGLVVDATVIMVESMFRRLATRDELAFQATMPYQAQGSDLRGKLLALFHGAIEVNRPILFAAAIIIAGFIPLFTLSGVEGHIFSPMAKTYAYAIAGGLIATFTITPAFAAILMPEHVEEAETRLMQVISRFYGPVLLFALRRKSWVLAGAALLLCVAVLIVRLLGLEFLPKLEEGNLWIRATLPSTISLEEGNNYVNQMRTIIGNFPEVESVVSQHGRPDDGTDATGFFNAEFFAPLKPASAWPKGMSKEQLTNEMLAKLQDEFLGVEFNFSQYLQDNVSEAVSGVKGENSIKLFGDDLEALTKTANQIKSVLAGVRGITDLAVFTSLGQPTVQIDIDRARAGRYGLTPGDINSTVRSAIGGDSAGELYVPNSDQHFPIIVRLAPRYRQSPEAIRDIPVAISGEKGPVQIPLSEVATVDVVSGAAYIYREQQQRYLPIKFSVRDRDLGSAIAEAQKKIAQQVVLPAGSRLEWVGEFGNLQEAIGRLRVVVPITLGLIALLLWINFGSLIDTLLTMSVIPMAVIGGLFGLYITGVPFSVSAAIGFIALFGISVMNGIVVLSQYNFLVRGGMNQMQAIVQTCALKIRPVLMTCVIAGVGLLPAAVSTGIGSQVQKPLAIVVVSGMTFAPFLILVVLPVLITLFPSRASRIRHSQTQERLAD